MTFRPKKCFKVENIAHGRPFLREVPTHRKRAQTHGEAVGIKVEHLETFHAGHKTMAPWRPTLLKSYDNLMNFSNFSTIFLHQNVASHLHSLLCTSSLDSTLVRLAGD